MIVAFLTVNVAEVSADDLGMAALGAAIGAGLNHKNRGAGAMIGGLAGYGLNAAGRPQQNYYYGNGGYYNGRPWYLNGPYYDQSYYQPRVQYVPVPVEVPVAREAPAQTIIINNYIVNGDTTIVTPAKPAKIKKAKKVKRVIHPISNW